MGYTVAKKNSNPAKVLLIPANTASRYPTSDWVHRPASIALMKTVKKKHLRVTTTDIEEISTGEKDIADLAEAKLIKFNDIDGRTATLIAVGFDYDGVIYSSSLHAQTRINAIMANVTAVEYPLTINSLDNASDLSIADKDAFLLLHRAMTATIQGHVDSGTALKKDVRTATTVAQVDAVVDSR